jgi:hypothetical protein
MKSNLALLFWELAEEEKMQKNFAFFPRPGRQYRK